jgi:hypothetical protein
MEQWTVSVDTIIRVVKWGGSEAILEGDKLTIRPRDGAPYVYDVRGGELKRRLVIQIGKLTGIDSHLFWHPDRMDTVEPPVSGTGVTPRSEPKAV